MQESWKVYSVTRKKVQQLEMKEYDEQFSPLSNPNQSVSTNISNFNK